MGWLQSLQLFTEDTVYKVKSRNITKHLYFFNAKDGYFIFEGQIFLILWIFSQRVTLLAVKYIKLGDPKRCHNLLD